MSVFNGLVHVAGGISFSGIALTSLAAHKCAFEDLPVMHGLLTTHKWVPWVEHC